MCFIDLQEAHDSIGRARLWEVLKRVSVPAKMLAIIRQSHDSMGAGVRTDTGEDSECFNNSRGPRQGCVLPPLPFDVFFAGAIRAVRSTVSSTR